MADDRDPATLDVQWSSSDACLHLYCECGAESHFDRPEIVTITCPACGATYALPTALDLKRLN